MTMQYVDDVGIENIQYGVWYLQRRYPGYAFVYKRKPDGWMVLHCRVLKDSL